MKTLSITFLVLIALSDSCKKDSSEVVKGYYDYMHFERQGGGEMVFDVYKTGNNDQLKVVVSKFGFRDTTLQIMLDNNTESSSAFSAFDKATSNQTQINGNFKQSTLPTGTWSYIYFNTLEKQTEVTNTDLRNTLLYFEQLVRSKVQ